MGTLESLISRYLDGELTAAEQHELRRLLAESPDARALFREMSAVAGAARRMPLLHRPAPRLEQTLFQRLQAEGLYNDAARTAGMRDAREINRGWFATRSREMVAAGIACVLLITAGLSWFNAPEKKMARAPIASLPKIGAFRGAGVGLPQVVVEREGETGERGRLGRRESRRGVVVVPVGEGVVERMPDVIGNDVVEHVESVENSVKDEGRSLLSAMRVDSGAMVRSNMPELPRENGVRDDLNHSAPPLRADARPGNEWIASLRGGLATVDGMDGKMMREFDVKIGIEIEGGHQVAFIGGLSSSLAETRSEIADVSFSAPAMSLPGQQASDVSRMKNGVSSDQEEEWEREFQSEPWFGLGYNYSLQLLKQVSIDPGVKAGAGASTWRVGLEVPVRVRVSEKMSLECAASVAHVLPRNSDTDKFQVTDTPDRLIYEGVKSYPSFTTYGIQVGVRLELAAP